MLHWVVKEGLREEVVFGQSSVGSKRISHVKTCRLGIAGNDHSKCKGPEVGTCVSEEEQESQEGSERYRAQGGLTGVVGTSLLLWVTWEPEEGCA